MGKCCLDEVNSLACLAGCCNGKEKGNECLIIGNMQQYVKCEQTLNASAGERGVPARQVDCKLYGERGSKAFYLKRHTNDKNND